MHLLGCSCRGCKSGKKSSGSQTMIISKKKSNRSKTKINCHKGDYDKIQNKVSIGYTD